MNEEMAKAIIARTNGQVPEFVGQDRKCFFIDEFAVLKSRQSVDVERQISELSSKMRVEQIFTPEIYYVGGNEFGSVRIEKRIEGEAIAKCPHRGHATKAECDAYNLEMGRRIEKLGHHIWNKFYNDLLIAVKMDVVLDTSVGDNFILAHEGIYIIDLPSKTEPTAIRDDFRFGNIFEEGDHLETRQAKKARHDMRCVLTRELRDMNTRESREVAEAIERRIEMTS